MLGYSFSQHIYICFAHFSFTEVHCCIAQIFEATFANFISAQYVNKQFIEKKVFLKYFRNITKVHLSHDFDYRNIINLYSFIKV